MSARGKKGGLLRSLSTLSANQRACVWSEPLWGIAYYLYIPYASLYMEALGMNAAEIGYVAAASLAMQALASLISGALTDKLGRRMTTFVIEFFAWTTPYALWALADGPRWFVAAGMLNALRRVGMTSWSLLMTEDAEPDQVVKCFSLIQVMGLTAGLFALVSQWGVSTYGLVPTMRIIYWLGSVMITGKAFMMLFMSHETEMGKARIAATRDRSIPSLLWESRKVFLGLLRERKVLYALGVLAAYQSIDNLNNSFWSLYLVDVLGIGEGGIAPFILLRSIVIFACVALFVPRLRFHRFRRPMVVCWGLFALSQLALFLGRGGALCIAATALNVVLGAIAMSVISPMADSLLVVGAEPEERARILGLTYAAMLVPVAVFPALAGLLTRYSMAAPFFVNIALCAAGALLTLCLWRERSKEEA